MNSLTTAIPLRQLSYMIPSQKYINIFSSIPLARKNVWCFYMRRAYKQFPLNLLLPTHDNPLIKEEKHLCQLVVQVYFRIYCHRLGILLYN